MSRSMFLPAKASAADAAAGASTTAAIRPARNIADVDDIDASAGCGYEPRGQLGHPEAGDNRRRGRPIVRLAIQCRRFRRSRIRATFPFSRQHSGPTMLHRPGVTQDLARFVVAAQWGDIPQTIRHEAKRALLNFFAVALAGCHAAPVDIALRSLAEFSNRRQATIIGRSERMDALSAAFLNAAGANAFDFCDTHVPTVIHPTAPVAPALLALSELRPVTGAELLLAFILGVELECRIGRAISPGHYAKGWHITATCGVFGAAAGTGKLVGLDDRRMVWALANASTQSSGLCECLGWPAKSIGVGNSARNGMWSALLAEKGFEGPPEPIAGVQGFLHAMAEPPDWSALTDGLGETW